MGLYFSGFLVLWSWLLRGLTSPPEPQRKNAHVTSDSAVLWAGFLRTLVKTLTTGARVAARRSVQLPEGLSCHLRGFLM